MDRFLTGSVVERQGGYKTEGKTKVVMRLATAAPDSYIPFYPKPFRELRGVGVLELEPL